MASELKVDKFTGVTTAGSILVTGEGNSTTTNLQQGLAKCWVNFDGSGTLSVRDSFSIASVTDGGTGNFTPNFSNAFNNTNYIGSGTPMAEYNHTRGNKGIGVGLASDDTINNQTTTALQMFSNYGSSSTSNGGAFDTQAGFIVFFGDLA